jgi:hypothetical protein
MLEDDETPFLLPYLCPCPSILIFDKKGPANIISKPLLSVIFYALHFLTFLILITILSCS